MHVGHPLASVVVPFGQAGSQPRPGQTPVGGFDGVLGGVQAGPASIALVPLPVVPPLPLLPVAVPVPVPVALPPAVVPPPAPQLQSHGGQVSPGAQARHAQAQVVPLVQVGPPSLHWQSQGGHVSPGAHAGQAHAQAPPEPLPALAPPPEQSHSTGGTVPSAFEETGLTHAQSVPPWFLA